MYLSKFVMNKEHPSAKQAMKNVQDFHRNLMTYFQNSRQEAGVLYRTNFLTKNPIVYVLSKIPPKNMRQGFMDLLESRSIDSYVESLSNGKIFSFDIFPSIGPNAAVLRAPAAAAILTVSSMLFPSRSPQRNAPSKLSPAPVASTGVILYTPASTTFSLV